MCFACYRCSCLARGSDEMIKSINSREIEDSQSSVSTALCIRCQSSSSPSSSSCSILFVSFVSPTHFYLSEFPSDVQWCNSRQSHAWMCRPILNSSSDKYLRKDRRGRGRRRRREKRHTDEESKRREALQQIHRDTQQTTSIRPANSIIPWIDSHQPCWSIFPSIFRRFNLLDH